MNQAIWHFLCFVFIIIFPNIRLCELFFVYFRNLTPEIYIFADVLISIEIGINPKPVFIYAANFSQKFQKERYHVFVAVRKVHCHVTCCGAFCPIQHYADYFQCP